MGGDDEVRERGVEQRAAVHRRLLRQHIDGRAAEPSRVVDLRSDTVTRPTAAMREAMLAPTWLSSLDGLELARGGTVVTAIEAGESAADRAGGAVMAGAA